MQAIGEWSWNDRKVYLLGDEIGYFGDRVSISLIDPSTFSKIITAVLLLTNW